MSDIDLKKLREIVQELHKINFGKNDGLINFDAGDDYRFSDVMKKCKINDEDWFLHKTQPDGVCNICKDCEFSIITHGTHTIDYLDAHINAFNDIVDDVDIYEYINAWSKIPVMFVMENPGNPDENLCFEKSGKLDRFVRKDWYWITDQKADECSYPKNFDCKAYGGLIYSIINTFHLANAYVTNMVKCGMTDGKTYLTTDKYNDNIVNNCLDHLWDEMDALRGGNDYKAKRVIVFAFGSRTYNKLWAYSNNNKEADNRKYNFSLYKLPHPASHLDNKYRELVLFGQILQALLKEDAYNSVEMPDFLEIFTKNIKDTDEQKDIERIENYDETEEILYPETIEKCSKKLKEAFKKMQEKYPELKSYKIKGPQSSYSSEKAFTYDFEYYPAAATESDDATSSIKSIILRYKRNADNDYIPQGYNVSWLKYDFSSKKISLYAGKGGTSNSQIAEEDYSKFSIYELMQNF